MIPQKHRPATEQHHQHRAHPFPAVQSRLAALPPPVFRGPLPHRRPQPFPESPQPLRLLRRIQFRHISIQVAKKGVVLKIVFLHASYRRFVNAAPVFHFFRLTGYFIRFFSYFIISSLSRYFYHLICFYDIKLCNIIKSIKYQAALVTGFYFFDIIFETFQGCKIALKDLFSFSCNTNLAIMLKYTIQYIGTCDVADTGSLKI